jgi:excisionase family DNA binding protein
VRVELELLTSGEAGEVLGVGDSRLQQMCAGGHLPAALTLAGGRHLFYRTDVERLRTDREV